MSRAWRGRLRSQSRSVVSSCACTNSLNPDNRDKKNLIRVLLTTSYVFLPVLFSDGTDSPTLFTEPSVGGGYKTMRPPCDQRHNCLVENKLESTTGLFLMSQKIIRQKFCYAHWIHEPN